MSNTTLDLRDRSPAERHAAVFEAFESLAPGEAVTVINDHDPSPLVHQMDAEFETFDAASSTIEQAGTERFEARLEKEETASGDTGDDNHEDAIRNALQGVTDPDLGISVVDAGLITSIEWEQLSEPDPTGVRIEVDPTGVDGAALDELESEIEAAVRSETTVDRVEVRRGGLGGGGGPAADEVRDRLADVSHPDRTVDIVEAGLVTDVAVSEGSVTVTIDDSDLPGDMDDLRGGFLELVGEAAYNAHGVSSVRIDTGDATVPIEPPRAEDPPLADAPGAGGPPGAQGPSPLEHGANQESSAPPTLDLSDVGDVVLVASAKGGVGKTTVATQLARGLAITGRDVGLLDADFSGPDVPQLLGLEPRITEGSVVDPVDHDDLQVMSVGLMENRPTAWNGEMVHNALFNLLEDVDWDVETLVVDLPPGASDTLMTFLQFVPIDGVVLVTTPYPTSVADTNEGASLFREGDVPVLGVVVNMATFACPGCGDEHELFPGADVEDALDYRVLAELPFNPDARSFTGEVPDRFQTLADTVAESIRTEEEIVVPDDAIDVRGMPDRGRVETIEDAFVAREPEETLTVVSDRHPAGLAVALVDVLGAEDSPSDVFEEYRVDARHADTWVLRVQKPPSPDEASA